MSLHPFSFVGLYLPSSSTLVLGLHQSSGTLASRTYIRSLCFLGSAWISSFPGSIAGGRTFDSNLAPPSIGFTMDPHPCYTLGCQLFSPSFISSMASPFTHSPVDYSSHSPMNSSFPN